MDESVPHQNDAYMYEGRDESPDPGAAISEATADLLAYEQYLAMTNNTTAVNTLARLVARWVKAARKLFVENEEAHMSMLGLHKDAADLIDRYANATDGALVSLDERHRATCDKLKSLERRFEEHQRNDLKVDQIFSDRLTSRDNQLAELSSIVKDEGTGLVAVADTTERRLDNLVDWAENVNRQLSRLNDYCDIPADAEERQVTWRDEFPAIAQWYDRGPITPGLADFIKTNVDKAGKPLTEETFLEYWELGASKPVHIDPDIAMYGVAFQKGVWDEASQTVRWHRVNPNDVIFRR